MDVAICYLEVFDEETTQWNYQCKSDNPEPINCWNNNLESFFDNFDLIFLLKKSIIKDFLMQLLSTKVYQQIVQIKL